MSQSHEVPADQVHYLSRPHFAASAYPGIPAQSSVPVSYTLVPPAQLRRSAYEKPLFPFFRREDPHEFAMLNMALENLLPPEEHEQYKYHILLDHLKLDSARHLALAYVHQPQP